MSLLRAICTCLPSAFIWPLPTSDWSSSLPLDRKPTAVSIFTSTSANSLGESPGQGGRFLSPRACDTLTTTSPKDLHERNAHKHLQSNVLRAAALVHFFVQRGLRQRLRRAWGLWWFRSSFPSLSCFSQENLLARLVVLHRAAATCQTVSPCEPRADASSSSVYHPLPLSIRLRRRRT